MGRRGEIGSLVVPAAALLFIACSGRGGDPASAAAPNSQELDAAEFHRQLNDANASLQIERVRVELVGGGHAEYLVTVKNSVVRRLVRAPFPGTLAQELRDAQIAYSVRPKNAPGVPDEQEHDTMAFRHVLTDPNASEDRAQIESIRAEPLGQGTARYVVALKPGSKWFGWVDLDRSGRVTGAFYAEYPDDLVAAIQRAGIPYTAGSQ